MGKGMTINCSMIEQNGEYEVGLNYKDSDGVDIDFSGTSDDMDSLLSEMIDDFVTDYLGQTKQIKQAKEEEKSDKKVEESNPRIKELEKIIEDLKAENYSLKVDNNVLQQRADDAVNNKKDVKSNSPKRVVYRPITLADMFDRIFY